MIGTDTAVDIDDLPAASTPEYAQLLASAFAEADKLLEGCADPESSHWQKVNKRLYDGTVICKTRVPKAGETGHGKGLDYHLRLSYHTEPSYDVFREYLYLNHTPNEKEYLEGLERTDLLKTIQKDEAEVWRNSYKLPFPTTNRDFAVLVLFRETQAGLGNRSFVIVSIPIKCEEQKGFVRGLYAAVEEVKETTLNGKAVQQWAMLTMSDPRGSIPKVVSEKVLQTQTARDVPDFFDSFLKKKNIKCSSETIA